jgi:hypothetical protein
MLRQSSSKKASHVVWDEENLKSNLEIQKQYSAVKIAEPKTPYRPPLLDAELDEEMRPLELEEEGEQCNGMSCIFREAVAYTWTVVTCSAEQVHQ